MNEHLLRVYKKLDVGTIKPHLMIYGDLSASCGSCNKIDFKLESTHCPQCQAEFKYISFRNPRVHIPKIYKLMESRPQLMIVDFDDYSKALGAMKARDFLK